MCVGYDHRWMELKAKVIASFTGQSQKLRLARTVTQSAWPRSLIQGSLFRSFNNTQQHATSTAWQITTIITHHLPFIPSSMSLFSSSWYMANDRCIWETCFIHTQKTKDVVAPLLAAEHVSGTEISISNYQLSKAVSGSLPKPARLLTLIPCVA